MDDTGHADADHLPIFHEARSNIDTDEEPETPVEDVAAARSPYALVQGGNTAEPEKVKEAPPTPPKPPTSGTAGSGTDAVAFLAKASGAAALEQARVESPEGTVEGFVPPGFQEEKEEPPNRILEFAKTLGTMVVAFCAILILLFGAYRVLLAVGPGLLDSFDSPDEKAVLYNITCAGFSACPRNILDICELEGKRTACIDIYNDGTTDIPGSVFVRVGVSIAGEQGMHTYGATRLQVLSSDQESCIILSGCTECKSQDWESERVRTFIISDISIADLKTSYHTITPSVDRGQLLQECTFGTDIV